MPGRLAHQVVRSEPIVESTRRVGTIWQAACGRYLRTWYEPRPWQASWVDPLDLRAEEPRGWCLKCAYWSALDALILTARNFDGFVAMVQADRYPLLSIEGSS